MEIKRYCVKKKKICFEYMLQHEYYETIAFITFKNKKWYQNKVWNAATP